MILAKGTWKNVSEIKNNCHTDPIKAKISSSPIDAVMRIRVYNRSVIEKETKMIKITAVACAPGGLVGGLT